MSIKAFRSTRFYALLLVLSISILVATLLEFTNASLWFRHSHIVSTSTPEQVTSDASANLKGEQGAKSSSVYAADLLSPTGNFVSNHRPNVRSRSASALESSCTTTPDATCQVVFTKDRITRSLPAKKVAANGSTYWSWRLQDLGLGVGSWKIQAVASLGSQSKTTFDALSLEVTQ